VESDALTGMTPPSIKSATNDERSADLGRAVHGETHCCRGSASRSIIPAAAAAAARDGQLLSHSAGRSRDVGGDDDG